MVRMYKHYNFHLGPNGAPTPVSMSSTPGWLSSVDDFYLTGADLCAIETTNGLNNHELLKKITPKGGLMSWVRVMVANYLATDGKSWSDTFSIQNGGTYNNQVRAHPVRATHSCLQPRTQRQRRHVCPTALS
jgi:hypothetical protein